MQRFRTNCTSDYINRLASIYLIPFYLFTAQPIEGRGVVHPPALSQPALVPAARQPARRAAMGPSTPRVPLPQACVCACAPQRVRGGAAWRALGQCMCAHMQMFMHAHWWACECSGMCTCPHGHTWTYIHICKGIHAQTDPRLHAGTVQEAFSSASSCPLTQEVT